MITLRHALLLLAIGYVPGGIIACPEFEKLLSQTNETTTNGLSVDELDRNIQDLVKAVLYRSSVDENTVFSSQESEEIELGTVTARASADEATGRAIELIVDDYYRLAQQRRIPRVDIQIKRPGPPTGVLAIISVPSPDEVLEIVRLITKIKDDPSYVSLYTPLELLAAEAERQALIAQEENLRHAKIGWIDNIGAKLFGERDQ